MSRVAGKVAAITGAGSGIGRALALELARRGTRGVAICDVDADGLEQTARQLAPFGADVQRELVDVAERSAVEAWAQSVHDHYGIVHQIYNNAGIAAGRTILASGYPELERVIGVDLWGVVHGTKAFLPHLIASGDGHVVNVSSLNGYFAQAKLAAYVTSKFAVRGFTETLRVEMLAAGLPVVVSVVHPGGVRTQIAENALTRSAELGIEITEEDRARARVYTEKLLRLDAGRAAKIVLDGVERDRMRILVGNDARVLDLVVRLLPTAQGRLSVLFDRLSGRA